MEGHDHDSRENYKTKSIIFIRFFSWIWGEDARTRNRNTYDGDVAVMIHVAPYIIIVEQSWWMGNKTKITDERSNHARG